MENISAIDEECLKIYINELLQWREEWKRYLKFCSRWYRGYMTQKSTINSRSQPAIRIQEIVRHYKAKGLNIKPFLLDLIQDWERENKNLMVQ